MHPKAAYLALRGCVPLRYVNAHDNLLRVARYGVGTAYSAILHPPDPDYPDWAINCYSTIPTIYCAGDWELAPDEQWEQLTWRLIEQFLSDRSDSW